MPRVNTLRGLGQDSGTIYDPVSGQYVSSLPAADNPLVSTPVFASTGYNVGDVVNTATPGVTGTGPSPTVSVPLSASSIPLFLESATLIPGVPNWTLMLGLVVGIGLLAGGTSRRRR